MAKINKKQDVDENVYELAVRRTRLLFERFDKVAVSFSGGKDSTAVLNIARAAAAEAGRLPLDVYTFDEEAIPPETVEYCARVAALPDIRFHWFCIPVAHRNACSTKEPMWYPWAPEDKHRWVRELPPQAITELAGFNRQPHHHVPPLIFPANCGTVCNLLGIRTQESMTRYQSVATKSGFECFTIPEGDAKWMSKAYPIYDWTVDDVWRAPQMFGWDWNRAYDVMEAAGVSRNEARCSPPYGEQPIRRLWSYRVCWPELWDKMTARVHGAATAARYANTELYGIGVADADLPEGKTWQSWTMERLNDLNGKNKGDVAKAIQGALREHQRCYGRSNKIAPPLPDDENDPVSGYCWKLLYPIAAAGGDKFGRQSQKARVRATTTRKKTGLCPLPDYSKKKK
jgi:predicted phosphoadenosine phosphosulfate sulfurtransferase